MEIKIRQLIVDSKGRLRTSGDHVPIVGIYKWIHMEETFHWIKDCKDI